MKYICTEDIENLAAQGKKELVVDENTVLMELARDTARQLGIAIVDGAQPKTSSPAAPSSPARDGSPAASKPPAKAPSQPAPAAPAATSNGSAHSLGAKPRGCQHGSLTTAPRPAPAKSHQNSDGVVDQLVELVRQSIGKSTGN